MEPTDPPVVGQNPRRFIPLLHLVHPAPPPSPRRKPQRPRHEGRVFTAEEQARLRLALKNAAKAAGGWEKLATAMQCGEATLLHAASGRRWGVSAALAIRLSRVTGFSLDDLLRPGLRVVEPRPGPDGAA